MGSAGKVAVVIQRLPAGLLTGTKNFSTACQINNPPIIN
jgi:hypothetical protein